MTRAPLLTLPIAVENDCDPWAVARERALREERYRRAHPEEAASADAFAAMLNLSDAFARFAAGARKAKEQHEQARPQAVAD